MAITFDVGFRADTKELSAQLGAIQRDIQNAFNAPASSRGMSTEIAAAVKQAQILEQTLKKATTDKGTSFIQMNLELKKMNTSAEEMVATFVKAGPAFSGSLNTMLQTFATADRNLLSMSAKIKEMGRVMTQSFKFTAAQSAIQFVTSEAQEAIQWVQELDSQLNTIQIVSGKTAAEMEKVYDVIIQKSKELRVTAQDYAEASQIFYQQGLGDEEVARRSEITIQAAKAAGQSTADMADQLTAVWNTYQMQGDELQRAASVGAKMGAETAVEFKDIAEAMQISASAASQMGVSYDSLAAIIATVGETTKQSASVIGNAYKTIFSRFYNLSAAGEEGAVELGRISANLKALGVDIMDASGELIDLDTVIQNVGNSWDTYTQKQKIAIAEQVGGTRQYGQFLALMENFEKYQKNLASANAETGAETLLAQYQTSLESIDSAMENASESWARAFSNVFTSDAQIEFYHGVEKIGNIFENVLDTAGGLKGIVTLLAAYFSRHLLTGLTRVKDVAKEFKANLNVTNQLKSAQETIQKMRAAGEDIIKNQPLQVNPRASSAERRSQTAAGMEDRTVEIGYLNTKLDMTEQVTQATIRLNDVMQKGSEQQQIQAQNLKDQLATQQQIVNASIDALKSERDAAKQRESRFANEEKILKRQRDNTRNGQQGARINQRLNQVGEVKAMAELNKAAASGEKSVSLYKEKLEALIKSVKGTDDASKELRASLEMVADGLNEGNIDVEEFTTRVQMAGDAMQTYADAQEDAGNGTFATQIQAEADASVRAAESMSNLNLAQSRAGSLSGQVKELFNQTGISMKALGNSAMATVSSLTMVGTAMSNIITSFQEGDATISGVASQMLILVPAAASLVKSLGDVIASIVTMAVQMGVKTTATLTAAAAEGTLTTATIAQSVANHGLMASLGPLLSILLAIAAAIAAIVAIVWVVVKAFQAMKAATPEAQLAKATEEAASFATALQEARDAANELQSAFDDYTSARDQLDNCTEGTQAWRDALQLVNSQVLDLLAKMPELAQYITNTNGMLEISQEGIDAMMKAQNEKVSVAQAAFNGANQKKTELDNQIKQADIIESMETSMNDQGVSGSFKGETEQLLMQYWDELSTLTGEAFETRMHEIFSAENGGPMQTGYMDEFIVAVSEAKNEMYAYSQSVEASKKANELANDTTALNYLSGQGYEVEGGFAAAYGDIYERLLAAEKESSNSNSTAAKYADTSTTDLADLFAATMNLDTTDMEIDGDTATINGTEYNKEQMIAALASAEALNKLGKVADQTTEELNGLDNVSKKFITEGGFEGLTRGEFENVKASIENGYGGSSAEYLKAQGLTDADLAASLGSEMDQALQIDWGSLLADFAEFPEAAQSALDKLTLDQAKKLADAYNQIEEVGGEELASMTDQIFAQMTTEQAEEAFDQLANIDWSSWDDIEAFKEHLKSLGIDFEAQGIDIEAYADQLQAVNEAMRETDLAGVAERWNAFKEKFSDLELGDTISAEDYATLGEGYKEYFQLMADGTYQLTTAAEEFKMAAKTDEQQEYLNTIAAAKQNNDTLIGDGSSEMSDSDQAMFAANVQEIAAAQSAYLATASSLEELDQLYVKLAQTLGSDLTPDIGAYQAALVGLASQYGNTAKEIEEYNLALAQGTEEEIAATESALRASTLIGEAAAKYDLSTDALEAQADALHETYKEQGMTAEMAAKTAIANQRMNKGISKLVDGLGDWKKTLKSTDKTSQDYAEAVVGVTDAVKDLVGATDDFELPKGFLDSPENMELLEKAAEGSQDAINQLGIMMASASVDAAVMNEAIVDAAVASGQFDLGNFSTATEAFESYKSQVMAGITTLQESLNGLSPGQDVTEMLGGDWVNALNQMAIATGMSVEQMNAMLNQLGVQAEVTTTNVPQVMEVPAYTEIKEPKAITRYETNSDGSTTPVTKWGWRSYTVPDGTETVEGVVQVAQIKASGNDAISSAPKLTWTGTGGGSASGKSPKSSGTSGGSGSGGSAPKHSAKGAAKREKVEDRYGTINSRVDKSSRALDRYSAAADSAFGAAKMRNLKSINKELVAQARNYNELYKKAKKYYGDEKSGDYADMLKEQKEAAETLGISLMDITTNADGFISNRTEVIAQLDERLEAAYQAYYQEAEAFDKAKSTDEAWSEKIDGLKADYEELKEAVDEYIASMDQVDETAQKMAEAMEEAVQAIRDHFSNLVEQSNLKLELRLAIDETDIKMAEFLIETLGDVGVRTGEAWGLLDDTLKSSQKSLAGMVQNTEEMFGILDQIKSGQNVNGDQFSAMFGEEAWKKYISGDGTVPQEVMDQLGEMADSMIDNLQTQFDTGAEMIDQYIQILEMAMDEFDKIATKIEQQNETLDMYMDLLEFSGQDHTAAGRKAVKDITDARMSNAALEVERAKAQLDSAKTGAELAQKELDDFYADYGKDESKWSKAQTWMYNQLKDNVDDAEDILNDAQSTFTGSVQDLAAAATEAIEQMAETIKYEVIENLGGDFAEFSSMTDMYDKQKDLDSFFLEDYDKTYQLNKLLGEIDDQMADITDPARLEEYNALIAETNALNQEGVNVTQKDIDLLNAKFAIQQAQDAYEEAKNAKNTMRLARDASGNWNYVYSSDQTQTEDAAQKLADAQYQYDKLLHEARDESEQLWMQAQQEFFEFQETIDWARYAADEKYKAEVDFMQEYYLQKTQLYSGEVIKYNDLLGANFADTTLGVITNYDSMEQAQADYTVEHENYHNLLEQNTQHYSDIVAEVCDSVGIDYDELAETIGDETAEMINENKRLSQNITDLKNKTKSELAAMSQNISSWRAGFVSEMDAAIRKVQELIAAIQALRNAQLAEASTGFDAEIDYTAVGYNAIAGGATVDQLKASEEGQKLAAEWANKVNSEDLAEAGHNWATGGVTSDDYWKQMENAVANGTIKGTIEATDTSDAAKQVGNQGSTLDVSKLPGYASGGLVTGYQIAKLAEDNRPEYVLNPDDTVNVLNAVKYAQQMVEMQMAQKKLSDAVAFEQAESKISSYMASLHQTTTTPVAQDVKIEATFPNVSVAAEIEEAFNNLVNQAVQYVGKANKK